MGFNSILKAFRATLKPGVADLNEEATQTANYPVYSDSENGDPNSDNFGNQWVKDAGLPLAFRDQSNPLGLKDAAAIRQIWEYAATTDIMYIGQTIGGGAPCALYQLIAFAGDPTVAWDADPIYLQLHITNNGIAPPLGRPAQFSMPVPRPPLLANYWPTVRTPFNSVSAFTGGIAIAFSSTPDNYTPGPVGSINANYAFYSYTPV